MLDTLPSINHLDQLATITTNIELPQDVESANSAEIHFKWYCKALWALNDDNNATLE